ncbi:MAG: MATE family efflux transporter [Dethiobacteraceae bacterium]|jgi:putative MATE family efflux protein|nr:MATE family efflux transporter [Bacillota bacterium]
MHKVNKLTEGNIYQALFKLALPIMGTSFVQLAYSTTDMMWVGRIGTKAVAAVGTAGFYTWLAVAFILIPQIGAEVGVAQAVGRKDPVAAKSYIQHSLQLIICLAVVYGAVMFTFRDALIGFFRLGDAEIISQAITYLAIAACGLLFYFLNPVLTAIFNGYGDSRTPFWINSLGLVVNMLLDPLLVLGWGPFPRLEVAGAAIATVIAQAVVTLVFLRHLRRQPELFAGVKLLQAPDRAYIRQIVTLGLPVALKNGLFAAIAMVIARIIAQWGPIPIAVQQVGSQIEAISWMTAGGFQTAMSTFVGQNYGAKKWQRVQKGYAVGMTIMFVFGLAASLLLIFAARPLFAIFITEAETLRAGIIYLRILGLSQLFMCLEATTAGAFNGLGNTVPPSVVSILFNGLRIPAALLLSATALGLNGVWWTISISSVFKGTVLPLWYLWHSKQLAAKELQTSCA